MPASDRLAVSGAKLTGRKMINTAIIKILRLVLVIGRALLSQVASCVLIVVWIVQEYAFRHQLSAVSKARQQTMGYMQEARKCSF